MLSTPAPFPTNTKIVLVEFRNSALSSVLQYLGGCVGHLFARPELWQVAAGLLSLCKYEGK